MNSAPGEWLTLHEAAQLCGISTRTLRRRIKDGELTAEKRPRGKQEVWLIQGAELARWAEGTGHTLTIPAEVDTGSESPPPDPGQQEAPGEQVTIDKPSDADRMTEAGAASGTGSAEDGGQPGALAAEEARQLRTEVDTLRRRVAAQETALQILANERDFLRTVVVNYSEKALPAAREEADELRTEMAAAEARRQMAEEALQAERQKSWWQKLRGR